ncbi:MAG: hypothetical protein AB7V14_02565 [Kiritimatiellia bacterium]
MKHDVFAKKRQKGHIYGQKCGKTAKKGLKMLILAEKRKKYLSGEGRVASRGSFSRFLVYNGPGAVTRSRLKNASKWVSVGRWAPFLAREGIFCVIFGKGYAIFGATLFKGREIR